MIKKIILFLLAVFVLLGIAVGCEHNVYLDGEPTKNGLWAVKAKGGTVYFWTLQEAVDYIIANSWTNELSESSKAISEDCTAYLLSDVLAPGSDGIQTAEDEKNVYDDSYRKGVIISTSDKTGDLCIDFGGYRYDFSDTIQDGEYFFKILSGDNIDIVNGESVIFETSENESDYALVVGTRTVTIDEHLIDDRRTKPLAVQVLSGGELVITASTDRESTGITGDFVIEEGGSLTIEDGVVTITSITKAEDSTFIITGGHIINPHDLDEIIVPAIDEEQFEANDGVHSYLHDWENMECNYEICGAEGHICICPICGAYSEVFPHSLALTYNTTHHWWHCEKCAYEEERELHVYDSEEDDQCNVCYYSRSSTATGLGVVEVNYEPLCYISDSHREPGTDTFVFTLTSAKQGEEYQPTSIVWTVYYVGDDGSNVVLKKDSSNKYTFTFTADKESQEYAEYRGKYLFVLCIYGNDFGGASDSSGINGWEI